MKVDDKFCIAFNTLRAENQEKKFSRKELQELFLNKIPGFSKQDYIISIFADKHIINKIGKGRNTRYMFTSTPVHVASLSNAVFSIKEYNNVHFKKSYDKKKNLQVESKVSGNYTHVDEEYCIKFLKERGYRIMKRIINFEEV